MRAKLAAAAFIALAFVARAQDNTRLEGLVSQVQSYLDKSPVLFPTLVFNQPAYVPGDTVFFKARFMDLSNRPVRGRAIMQMVLLNANGNTVDKIYFSTADGSGYSQMVLPDTLSAGRYRVVVFNDWMKNFGSSTFFEKEISIFRGKELARKIEPLKLSFFPEGGQLVQSVPGKVVVFANQPGRSLSIRDNDSLEVGRVVLDETGMGFFVFTPQPGRHYFATEDNGSTRQFPLPATVIDGMSVLVTPNQNREPVRVLLTVPRDSKLRTEELSVLVVAEQQTQFSAAVRMNEKEAVTLGIPQKKLPEGIAQLLVIDKANKVLAQRCFLVQDRDSLSHQVQISGSTFGQRALVKVDAIFKDAYRNSLKADLVVSAVNRSMFSDRDTFTPANPANVNEILTGRFNAKNWVRFNTRLIAFPGYHAWNEILMKKPVAPVHPLRTLVHKNGKAVFKTTGQPVPDSTIVTVYLQKHFMGYEAIADRDGKFALAFLFDFFGKDEMFYVAEHKGNLLKDVELKWDEEFFAGVGSEQWTEQAQTDKYSEFRKQSKLITPSYRFFSEVAQTKTNSLANPNAEYEDEFMGADVTVNVEDYVVFPTMEELIREVIPSLQHRRVRGNSTVRVVFSVPSILPTGDPVYIIDGVMTKNSDFFLSLRPADILTMKIEKELNKLTRLGAIGKNGIVYVQTKKQDTAERLRAVNTMIPILGLSKPVERKWPVYETAADWRKPDFRSSVYWNPSVKTDASGEATLTFYLGDDVGPVEISIQGFTEDGRPFSFTEQVHVNFAPTAKN